MMTHKLRQILIWLIFSSVITISWFTYKMPLSSVEEGPIFENPQRTFQVYKYVWTDSGLGLSNPLNSSRVIIYFISNIVFSFGVEGYKIQWTYFFLLYFFAFYGAERLIYNLFPDRQISVNGAILYGLNMFVEFQIWNRFLLSQIVLWGILPLALYMYKLNLEKITTKRLLILFLVWIMLAPAFSTLSSAMVFIILSSSISAIYILKDRKNIFKKTIRVVVFLLMWLVCNFWWIVPLVVSSNDNNFSMSVDKSQNITALVDVTKYFTLKDVVFLKQNYYLSKYRDWNKFSFNNLGSSLVLFLSIIGVLKYRKNIKLKFFFIIFLIGLFIAKGSNPPLGKAFFEFIFEKFSFTQVLRNPYEKIGLIMVLPYAIFFGMGTTLKIFKNINLLNVSLLVYLCGFMLNPIWNGDVVRGFAAKAPDTYKEINSYLQSNDTHRMIIMPFLHGAVTGYAWGYSSIEPSELLFNYPALSRTFNGVDDVYSLLYDHIRKKGLSNIFYVLGIDTIVLHKDVVPSSYYQENVTDSRTLIDQWENVKIVKENDDIVVYKYNTNTHVDWGYITRKIVEVSSIKEGIAIIIDGKMLKQGEAFTIKNQNSNSLNTTQFYDVPKYKLIKKNATSYRFEIVNATSPFVVILSSTYNNNWEATIENEQLKKHFNVNGFANAWTVNKIGTYNIDINYRSWPKIY